MHALIERLLQKRNIKSTKDLDTDERATFDRWQTTLSEGDITVDRIAQFCKAQRKAIELLWRDGSRPKDARERDTVLHSVYGTLLDVIEGPKAERGALEKYLNALIAEP